MTGFYNLLTEYQVYVYILVGAALFVDGILFIIPSEKAKDMAIKSLPFVAIGAGLILLAFQFGTEIAAKFVF